MNRIALILIAVSLAILIGCSNSKIVLQGPSGGKTLIYDSNNFHPQVETPEDIEILVEAASQTLTNAIGNESMVTVQEISDAMKASDWRKLERVVVAYRASHRK